MKIKCANCKVDYDDYYSVLGKDYFCSLLCEKNWRYSKLKKRAVVEKNEQEEREELRRKLQVAREGLKTIKRTSKKYEARMNVPRSSMLAIRVISEKTLAQLDSNPATGEGE